MPRTDTLTIGADDEFSGYCGDLRFAAWLRRVNRHVRRIAGGLGIFDFADAPWRDAYDADPGLDDVSAALDTLADWDETFAGFLDLSRPDADDQEIDP